MLPRSYDDGLILAAPVRRELLVGIYTRFTGF